MKKGDKLFLIAFLFVVISAMNVSATTCDLTISLINQDPMPAIPGESVRLIFQVDGVENSECGTVEIELLENYPITLEPGQKAKYSIESGIYAQNYQSFFIAPYKAIVDKDALNGESIIEIGYKYSGNKGYIIKQFELDIEDTRADFEVFVKNYNPTTNILTLEILNIAGTNVEALTIEIPDQENIIIKGSNRNIVGDLDSNEYTTTDFRAIPKDGEIELLIHYTDKINERRTIEEEVTFNGKYFKDLGEKKGGISGWFVFLIVVLVAGYLIYRRKKKKKQFKEKLKRR